MRQRKNILRYMAILVILTMINLPLVSSLEISGVRADSVTQSSANIAWNTDEAADSFVNYGTSKDNLQTLGDAKKLTSHSIALENLKPQTTYHYSVRSANVTDDNKGALYTFKTPAPDTTPPSLQVEIPKKVFSTRLDVRGTSEDRAKVTILVNGVVAATVSAEKTEISGKDNSNDNSGDFAAVVTLKENSENVILIKAQDAAKNTASKEFKVFADTKKPLLTFPNVPKLITDKSFEFSVTSSTQGSFEVFVNNRSQIKEKGLSFKKKLSLNEGANEIKVEFVDGANRTITRSFTTTLDTKAPDITVKVAGGNEYYQGRATSTISGKTEPGSNVFLYVYRPQGTEYKPDFKTAWTNVTADNKGEYEFKDVNFERAPINLKSLAPRQVPSNLLKQTINPINTKNQEQFPYYVFVIAQDKSGKTKSAQTIINLKTCFSSGDFAITSMPQFRAPLRLHPQLLDEGRESISMAFNLSYRGGGKETRDPTTGTVIPGREAVKITNVQFQKACTQGTSKEEAFKLGCAILPNAPKTLPNVDKTNWFVTYNLHSSKGLSKKDNDYWNQFKKSQVTFPLKIKVTYSEHLGGGKFGPTKTDTSCHDVKYFVDIPVDTQNLLPDVLADGAIDGLNWTVDKIDTVLPILEKAILVTGIGCVGSFLSRLAVRLSRLWVSKLEFIWTKNNKPEEQCPLVQDKLLLESTITHWKEVQGTFDANNNPSKNFGKEWFDTKKSLDKKCPKTASLWKAEAALDQAYRWTCDRVFCRAVPAGWTAKQDKKAVDEVILSQQQCTATGRGIPLKKIENCQEQVKAFGGNQKGISLMKKGSFTCYLNPTTNQLYYTKKTVERNKEQVVKLEWISSFGKRIEQVATSSQADLFAYTPPGSKDYIVGVDQTCDAVCKNPRKPGYIADKTNSVTSYYNGKAAKHGCYKEVLDPTTGKPVLRDGTGPKGQPLKGINKIPAGYTKDCFVNTKADGTPIKGASETGLLQCVCTQPEKKEKPTGARVAAKATDSGAEDWVYRQDQLHRANKAKGTQYPSWRYYASRDRSSAFGADYLTDYLRDDKNKAYHQVNPHTQHIGAFQTMCLSGVRARMVMLKSMLQAAQNCLTQAKTTGIQDAGICKTLLSQQVCGLVYKGISAITNQCSPSTFQDVGKGGFMKNADATIGAGVQSIGQAMQSSIDDIKSDYANANIQKAFQGGTKSFTQSMCMAAFGYDFPLGADFILDSAYSTPMKSTVHVIPAERELATYNPASGTVIYNYNVGAMILPGCKVQNYDVKLKCIGPEDRGKKGVECGPQGCDCLQATSKSSTFENEKVKFLDGGRGTNLKQHTFFSVPLRAPQKVDSHFRYDHVVVDIKLDPKEDPKKCFDTGYLDGKFYFPIKDLSPPGQAQCQVNVQTGQYSCPQFVKLFGGGSGAYFTDPLMTCYNKRTQNWESCNGKNLFIKGDQIRIKPQIQTDGGKYCLRTTVTGLDKTPRRFLPQPLPEKIATTYSPEISLGSVTEELFTGTTNIVLNSVKSKKLCAQPKILSFAQKATTKDVIFNYELKGGKYVLKVPAGVELVDANSVNKGYSISNTTRTLMKGKSNQLAFSEIQTLVFDVNGFRVSNLIGRPAEAKGACVYTTQGAASKNYKQNAKQITVLSELLLPDASGNCFNAKYPVKPPAFGKAKVSQSIQIQLESVKAQVVNKLHSEFMAGNCNFVIQNSQAILARKQADKDDLLATYYTTACLVTQGGKNWKTQFGPQVCTYSKLFFERFYVGTQEKAPVYPKDLKNSKDYKKIWTYMNTINSQLKCGVTTGVPVTRAKPAIKYTTTCGHPGAKFNVGGQEPTWTPTNWKSYTCQNRGSREAFNGNKVQDLNEVCWPRSKYSSSTLAKSLKVAYGCPGNQLCCPTS